MKTAASTPRTEGLRARKKRATRTTIQRVALELFTRQGYDETTTDAIARAADVSPGTLFNYFPTKEALVADDYDPLFVELLESRPPGEPMYVAIRRALEAGLRTVVDAERKLLLARARLALEVPALRAASLLERERSAALLREVLARRYHRRPDDFELKVVSALVVSAMVTAMEAWLASGGRADPLELVDRALAVAERGARLDRRGDRT